ncbi:MAG: 50S ribosomal protein L18 [Lentisphaerae bacterium]|nr:50S ribosomal protein L18 [Lentisphaerota bacterium]
MKLKDRKISRAERHRRVRKHVFGTSVRPRMAVMFSSRHIYVQFINDESGVTLASVSTLKDSSGGRTAAFAREFGKRAGEVALQAGVKDVVVDRGGFRFHGRLKAIVQGVLEGGVTIGDTEKIPVGSPEMNAGQDGDNK